MILGSPFVQDKESLCCFDLARVECPCSAKGLVGVPAASLCSAVVVACHGMDFVNELKT